MNRIVVGTDPVLLAGENPNRAAITITMPSTAVESANTGRVHVGFGFVPTSTTGSPNQGDAMLASAVLVDAPSYPNDPTVHKGQVWAVASAASQVVLVDEVTENNKT